MRLSKIQMNNMLLKSAYPHYRKARKGQAWTRKLFKKLLVNECQCGSLMVNRTSRQKCDSCKEREWRESRLRTCSCGTTFMLMDHQAGGERVCPHCREGDYVFLYDRLRLFIDNPDRYYAHTPLDFRMWKYASKGRNDVQSTSDYRDFKRNYKFVNMNKKIPTWDHVNSMTYILYHYLKGVLVTREFDGSFLEFVEYYDKYAVQFPVLPGDNQALK